MGRTHFFLILAHFWQFCKVLKNWNQLTDPSITKFLGVVLFAKNLGLGVETASLCETLHALSMEVEPSKIVFDSPCKTKSDLEQAMKQGVHINLDNEHEMEMIEELLKKNSCLDSKSNIGLRINPVVGKDKMVSEAAKLAFTASKASKFGLPILPETKVCI